MQKTGTRKPKFYGRRREIVAIVGQNGSGKSTIGKLIAGILPLKHGSIQVDELELSKKKMQNLFLKK